MTDILNCEKREITGTLRNRRLRQSGMTPAILYRRGESINLSIPTRDINAVIRHGSQIVELKGGCNESAMIKEVQWDPFGIDVLHVDLTRINASEVVQVTLQLELVGVAPGTRVGGMLKHVLHEVEVECKASDVPDKLELKINDLELNDSRTANDIRLPAGVTLVSDPDEIVVQCVEVVVKDDADGGDLDVSAEPEVIGRGGGDDAEDEN